MPHACGSHGRNLLQRMPVVATRASDCNACHLNGHGKGRVYYSGHSSHGAQLQPQPQSLPSSVSASTRSSTKPAARPCACSTSPLSVLASTAATLCVIQEVRRAHHQGDCEGHCCHPGDVAELIRQLEELHGRSCLHRALAGLKGPHAWGCYDPGALHLRLPASQVTHIINVLHSSPKCYKC